MPVFSFNVDEAYAKKNNELLKDTRRLQASAALFGLVQLAIGFSIFLYVGRDTLGWIVLAVFALMSLVSFAMIAIIPKQVGSATSLYAKYDLAPAMIAQVDPHGLKLLALVNLNIDPAQPPRYGLAMRSITKLDGHKREIGERVPAVAVSGRRSSHSQATWDEISPMPIAWATQDAQTIARAEKEIPATLWSTLESNLDRLADVRATRFNLLELD
ncbi:DUF3239 domain-containing protein [Corynebacterium sp. SCR221107]|uniref:DUF3239 domain-containing protein n=1 Tax=Corynebacterium sp. SCR221107 TaxID=3017361 RepID=UPI0022EC38F4|nr:DUF3239 domain-containing protein [Corynebacterium sp. SCR221107]WBT09510.1 DUF3239 domain-containing protein [Corynebacterium sp. SCR221107]